MREALLFDGLGWPAARVVDRKSIVGRPASGFFADGQPTRWAESPIIDTSGHGRRYRVRYAEAWWRDLSEVLIEDEQRALSFLARRGDPFGELAPGKPIALFYWEGLILRLQQAASAWETVRDWETSTVSAFRPERCAFAEQFHTSLPADWLEQLSVTYDGVVPVLRAKMLFAYLIAAAATALRQRLPMRRCAYCYSWFTLHYAAARHCSPSCRAAEHNKRTSPHGLRSQDHHPDGSDPLAGAVDHPGPGPEPDRTRAQLRNPETSQGPRREDARGGRAPRRRRSAPV
jgi:hypothetical protein